MFSPISHRMEAANSALRHHGENMNFTLSAILLTVYSWFTQRHAYVSKYGIGAVVTVAVMVNCKHLLALEFCATPAV